MTAIARLLRATAAAATMAAILGGLPVALWVLGSPLLPDHFPGWQETLGALTRRDDGRVFLACLVLLGFLAWIMLAISVLAELAAALRGRTAAPIKLPGFRLSQAFASALVAAVISGAGTPASALAAAPVSISVIAPPQANVLASTAAASRSDATPPPRRDTPAVCGGPVYHVNDRDTLWGIAQRTLGDPLRWREILALNIDCPQPDGHHLTEDTILHVGWLLRLPAGATIPSDEADSSGVVTVEPGDTLRQIARDRLGSASRYAEIEDLNAGRVQPDGEALHDPDLIRPGWALQLPTRADAPERPQPTPAAPAPAAPPPAAPTPATSPPAAPPPSPGPAESGTDSRPAPPPPPDTPHTPAPAGTGSSQPAQPGEPTTAPDAEATSAALPAALGLSGLLASGLLGGLAAHRRRQRRQRSARRQLPVPDQQTARLEWAAHTVAAQADTAFLDRALRCLAAALADTTPTAGTVGAEPDVLAVWLAPSELRLVLSEPCPPIAPFTASADDPEVWVLPADAGLPVRAEVAAYHPAPLPTLTSVGHADDQLRHLLLDLERLGVVHIVGDRVRCADLLRHLAAELAHHRWSDGVDVLLAGFGADLVALNPDRIRHVADVEAGLAELQSRHAATQTSLSEHHLDTVLAGRARAVASEAWMPRILLAAGDLDTEADQTTGLAEVLTDTGPGAAALIIADPADRLDLPGWRLEIDDQGALRIPGLMDTPIVAEGLPAHLAAGLVQLVRTTTGADQPVPPAGDPYPWAQDMNADGTLRPVEDRDPTQDTPHTPRVEPAPRAAGQHDLDGDAPLSPTGSDAHPDPDPDPDPDDVEVETLDEPPPTDPAPAPHELLESHPAAATVNERLRASVSPHEMLELDPAAAASRRQLAVVESQDPHLDDDLQAWRRPGEPDRPLIGILGAPWVRGPGTPPEARRDWYTEVLVYLALHPHGVTADEVLTDLWPEGHHVQPVTLRRAICGARRWAGTDTRRDPPADRIPNLHTDGRYRLSDYLLDWDLFRRLRKRGQARLAAGDPSGGHDYRAALDLVRGPVLTPLRHGGYGWLTNPDQRHDTHIPGFIADTAHELVAHALPSGDIELAGWAADIARRVDPYADRPLTDLMRIAHATDNRGELERLAAILLDAQDAEVPEDLPHDTFLVFDELFPTGYRPTATSPARP